MLSLIGVLLPVVLLVGVGYGARAAGVLGDRTGDGLSDFVFVLAVPCLLFRTLAQAEIPAIQPWGYWIAYFTGVAIVWALGMLAARKFAGAMGPTGIACGFAAAQSNTVLVGIPIILKAFGDEAAVPLALLLAVHLPITMGAATILAEGRQASLLGIARKLATHPIIVGILLGSLARPFASGIPAPIWNVIDLVAGAAVPAALITLGLALYRYGLVGGLKLPLALGALKLVVHPAIVFVLAVWVFAMPPVWAGVAIMFAACPCGINAYLFAERYRAGMAETSTAIALSTPLSGLTMLAWLALLGVGG